MEIIGATMLAYEQLTADLLPKAESRADPQYDDRACRRQLAKTIDAHQSKLAELVSIRGDIKRAEVILAETQQQIDQTAGVEDDLSEAAGEALRRGTAISERSEAWKAKAKRDGLIEQVKLWSSGLARLKANAVGLEGQVAAELAELHRVREPIVQHVFKTLADELSQHETISAQLRARLFGFSVCSNGPAPQRLPPIALSLLRNPPANSKPPQINSPAHNAMNREKEIFRSWKKALESDASAVLNL
jgi:hypothetical protein